MPVNRGSELYSNLLRDTSVYDRLFPIGTAQHVACRKVEWSTSCVTIMSQNADHHQFKLFNSKRCLEHQAFTLSVLMSASAHEAHISASSGLAPSAHQRVYMVHNTDCVDQHVTLSAANPD